MRFIRIAIVHLPGLALTFWQMSGLDNSGWVVLAPLLVVRFLFDLSAALRARGSAAA